MSPIDQTPDFVAESAAHAVAEALLQEPPDPLPAFLRHEDDEQEQAESEPRRPAPQALQFATAAAIAFSLTLLVGAGVVIAGYVPLDRMALAQRVDLGAVLLFAPVCALVLALTFEVAVIALKAPPEAPEPRRLPIDWAPGHREG